MKKKILAAVLAAAMVMSMTGVSAAAKSKEKSEGTTFVYGTTGYSEEMGDAGLNLTAAKRCLTLLKNDQMLPLDKEKIHTIGVIGPNATIAWH